MLELMFLMASAVPFRSSTLRDAMIIALAPAFAKAFANPYLTVSQDDE